MGPSQELLASPPKVKKKVVRLAREFDGELNSRAFRLPVRGLVPRELPVALDRSLGPATATVWCEKYGRRPSVGFGRISTGPGVPGIAGVSGGKRAQS